MRDLHKIAGNDIIEMWAIEKDNMPHLLHADRQSQDQRAKIVFDFLRAWGYAAAFADIMPTSEDHPAPKRIPPNELAIRACEIVDAAWCELQHRGWIVNLPPYNESLADV